MVIAFLTRVEQTEHLTEKIKGYLQLLRYNVIRDFLLGPGSS